jgi:hypothetical protein
VRWKKVNKVDRSEEEEKERKGKIERATGRRKRRGWEIKKKKKFINWV